jgi:hypothetical protein
VQERRAGQERRTAQRRNTTAADPSTSLHG